jgi:hypothetical protein
MPGSRSYAAVQYRCSLLPLPVVSGSAVYWIDQTTSAFCSLPIVQRSRYLGSSVKRGFVATAVSSTMAASMSALVRSVALGFPARVR